MRIKFEAHFVFVSINAFRFSQPSRFVLRDLSAFVVFSMMGFYPVTPGSPTYNIGSPVFSDVKIDLGGGNVFEIVADGASHDNKYVQSATLNGEELSGPWFDHSRITAGGVLSLKMGPKANKKWGIGNPPPSVGPMQK